MNTRFLKMTCSANQAQQLLPLFYRQLQPYTSRIFFWHLVCNRIANDEERGPIMKTQTIRATRSETAVRHSFRSAVISLALFCAACGGGGGGSAPAAVNVAPSSPALQTSAAANAFAVTSDSYGMQGATYLASSKSSLGIVMRAAIATSMTDQNFQTVSRIDIPPNALITPASVYSLGTATATGRLFPGNLYFLNGHPSTLLKTVDGTITFTSFGSNSGDRISGSFSAVVEDGNDPSTPKARYTIAADFDFVTDSFGPVLPAAPSLALAATPIYDLDCASCHSLGSHDTTAAGAGDLALKGGTLDTLFSAGQPGHQGIRLAASDISALKVLLNSN